MSILKIKDENDNFIEVPALRGEKGEDGVGIKSVTQTTTSSADAGNNVITVIKTDNTTSTFTVKNGSKGSAGDQGFSILRVTTALSSYTTTVGGFTPKYRIALSTVLSQSGASKVRVGDTILRNYYTYSVGYVDSSYVYVGDYASIRGSAGTSVTISSVTESEESGGENVVTFSDAKTLTIKNGVDGRDGENGYTPVKGTDYFTEADKNEFVEQVLELLEESTTESLIVSYTDGQYTTNNGNISSNSSLTMVEAHGLIAGRKLHCTLWIDPSNPNGQTASGWKADGTYTTNGGDFSWTALGNDVYECIIPANVEILKFNIYTNQKETAVCYMPIEEEENTYIESYITHSVAKPLGFEYGKKLIAFGDSITAGVYSSSSGLNTTYDSGYIHLLCSKLGITLTNKALSGTTLANVAHPTETTLTADKSIYGQVTATDLSTYDYILVAGGCNDGALQTTLGVLGNSDNTTVYGALESMCQYIQRNKKSTAQVIFLTPIPLLKDLTIPLEIYRNAVFEVAVKYGFNVVDGYKVGFPYETGDYSQIVFPDGCHPSIEGHRMYANSLLGLLGEKNTSNLATIEQVDLKLPINQGSENVGKILVVGTDGNLTLIDMPEGGATGDVTGVLDESNNILLTGNLADGTYTLKWLNNEGEYVDAGTIEVGTVTPDTPAYTNLADPNSTNTTDWSIWINDARFGNSDGTYRQNAGTFVSNYIPYDTSTGTHVLRAKGIIFAQVAFYSIADDGTVTYRSWGSEESNDNFTYITVNDDYVEFSTPLGNVTHIRIQGTLSGTIDDVIITVDEEIIDDTEKERTNFFDSSQGFFGRLSSTGENRTDSSLTYVTNYIGELQNGDIIEISGCTLGFLINGSIPYLSSYGSDKSSVYTGTASTTESNVYWSVDTVTSTNAQLTVLNENVKYFRFCLGHPNTFGKTIVTSLPTIDVSSVVINIKRNGEWL